MKRLVLFLFLVFMLASLTSALGISPASKEINFLPGAEHIITYTVFSENENAEIILELAGDLAQYATISKDRLLGTGSFVVKIKFPQEVERPGLHTIGVQAREKIDRGGAIGTSVAIHSNIKVLVPYPGRFLEAILSVEDGNIDSEIPFQIKVINRGIESLSPISEIKFFTEHNQLVKEIGFERITLTSAEEGFFKGTFNSKGLKPGNFFANATVIYGDGDFIILNDSFRVGSLFVNITNFTEELPQKGIQKFFIGIESRWNSDLQEVFADVNLTKNGESVAFRTPSVDLKGWGTKTLEGFIDTSEMEGEYDVEVTLNYAGHKTVSRGVLTISKFSYIVLAFAAGTLFLIILIGIIVFIILRRNKSKKRR